MNWLILMMGFVLASLPLVLRISASLRLLAFVLAYVVFVVAGRLVEANMGQNATQGWAFYVVTFLLFIVAAFPAFIWRYLWKK